MGKINRPYIQIWTEELALSIYKHHFLHTNIFWYFYKKSQRNSDSDASAGANDEASSVLDTSIQTQRKSATDASTGENCVSSSGLDKNTNHHCNMDSKNNYYSQSYETPQWGGVPFLLFRWYNLHQNHTTIIHTAYTWKIVYMFPNGRVNFPYRTMF